MKYALIVILIALAWVVKVLVGYYLLARFLTWAKPWYYWLRGVRPDKQGEPDFALVLKSLRLAAKSPGHTRRDVSEVADLLYNVGGVRDTTTICAAIVHCAGVPEPAIAAELGEATASVVKDARDGRDFQPLPEGSEVNERDLAIRQVRLCAESTTVSHLATPLSDEAKLALEDAQRTLASLQGTNQPLEQHVAQLIDKARQTPDQ